MSLNLECGEYKIWDDDGELIYHGPRFVRCFDCQRFHTIKEVHHFGSCVNCGLHKFKPVLKVTPTDLVLLESGTLMMYPWEMAILKGQKVA